MSIGEHFHHGLGWTCESVDERLKSLESQNERLRRELAEAKAGFEAVTDHNQRLEKAVYSWKAKAGALLEAIEYFTDPSVGDGFTKRDRLDTALAAFKEPKG